MEITSKVTCIEFNIKMCPAELKAIKAMKERLLNEEDGVTSVPGKFGDLYSFLQRFTIDEETEV